MTNKNKYNIGNKNRVEMPKEVNISSNLSPPHFHYFSNKNFFTKIKPNLSNNKYNKINNSSSTNKDF